MWSAKGIPLSLVARGGVLFLNFFKISYVNLRKLDKYSHLRTEVNLSELKLFSKVIGKMTIMGIVKMTIFFDQKE